MLAKYLSRNDLRIVIKKTMVLHQQAVVAYVEYKDNPKLRVYFQEDCINQRSASFAIKGDNGVKALCGLVHRLSKVDKPLFTVNTQRMNFDRLPKFDALQEFAHLSKLKFVIDAQLLHSGQAVI